MTIVVSDSSESCGGLRFIGIRAIACDVLQK
jgi:hypothetical protein